MSFGLERMLSMTVFSYCFFVCLFVEFFLKKRHFTIIFQPFLAIPSLSLLPFVYTRFHTALDVDWSDELEFCFHVLYGTLETKRHFTRTGSWFNPSSKIKSSRRPRKQQQQQRYFVLRQKRVHKNCCKTKNDKTQVTCTLRFIIITTIWKQLEI